MMAKPKKDKVLIAYCIFNIIITCINLFIFVVVDVVVDVVILF